MMIDNITSTKQKVLEMMLDRLRNSEPSSTSIERAANLSHIYRTLVMAEDRLAQENAE